MLARLGIDPDRIVLLGLSAGAHLAMLAHTARGLSELEPDLPADLRDVSEDVRALIVHYGPFDLRRGRAFPDGTDPTAELLGPRSPRQAGFKCPHCRLFVSYDRAPKPASE